MFQRDSLKLAQSDLNEIALKYADGNHRKLHGALHPEKAKSLLLEERAILKKINAINQQTDKMMGSLQTEYQEIEQRRLKLMRQKLQIPEIWQHQVDKFWAQKRKTEEKIEQIHKTAEYQALRKELDACWRELDSVMEAFAAEFESEPAGTAWTIPGGSRMIKRGYSEWMEVCNDTIPEEIIEAADKLMEIKYKDHPREMGLCHQIWADKVSCLIELGYRWYRPSEIHKGVCFD